MNNFIVYLVIFFVIISYTFYKVIVWLHYQNLKSNIMLKLILDISEHIELVEELKHEDYIAIPFEQKLDKAIDETLLLNKKYLKILSKTLQGDSFGIDDYSRSAQLLRKMIIQKSKYFIKDALNK